MRVDLWKLRRLRCILVHVTHNTLLSCCIVLFSFFDSTGSIDCAYRNELCKVLGQDFTWLARKCRLLSRILVRLGLRLYLAVLSGSVQVVIKKLGASVSLLLK